MSSETTKELGQLIKQLSNMLSGLATKDDLQSLDYRLGNIERDTVGAKSDLARIKETMATKEDVNTLREDTKETIRQNVEVIRADLLRVEGKIGVLDQAVTQGYHQLENRVELVEQTVSLQKSD